MDHQVRPLTEASCIRLFADKKSGMNVECEETWKALDCGSCPAPASTADAAPCV